MDADDQVSLRSFLRSLPSVAFWMLLLCVGLWALTLWLGPHGLSFWYVLLAWPVVTIAFGPIFWIRYRRGGSGWWVGWAVAMLWGLCAVPLLVGLAYAAAAVFFDVGK